MKIAHSLTLLAIACAPAVLAACSPTNRALRSSLSDMHLKVLGGVDALRAPQGNAARLHVMLIAEDRDLDWAEETERRITQFVGVDQDSDQFDLFGVECRKSICEIQAVSDNPSSGSIWDRVVDDITNQPWNDFNQTSSSTEILNGQLVVLTHLLRRDSKYKHCFVNPDQGTCPDPDIEQ